MPSRDRYDRNYFDKWYRDPVHRVSTASSTRRKAAMVLAVAEYYLERPVRTVLDVGCGEGQWQPALKSLRPGIRYLGIDPSEYAVRRFGRRRNLRLGGFADLPGCGLAPVYDVIVCSDLLYYVPSSELRAGLKEVIDRLEGVAFLEAYASDAAIKGDFRTIEPRSDAAYRRLFRSLGLISCGPHCYAGPMLAGQVTKLERGGI